MLIAATIALAAGLGTPATVTRVDYYPAGCNPVVCYPAGVEIHTNQGAYTGDLEDRYLRPGTRVLAPHVSPSPQGKQRR